MKLLICDDHISVREGLRSILEKQSSEVCSLLMMASNAREAYNIIEEHKIDVALLDLKFPDGNGFEILSTIMMKWPETKVIIYSMLSQENYVLQAQKMGAEGYITKNDPTGELVKAIRIVAGGGSYFSKTLGKKVLKTTERSDNPKQLHESLTIKEMNILMELITGDTNNNIAAKFSITPGTLSVHKSTIMRKLHVTNDFALKNYCIEHNLFE